MGRCRSPQLRKFDLVLCYRENFASMVTQVERGVTSAQMELIHVLPIRGDGRGRQQSLS